MDDRLRGFSPPPWAALGRRDPNHEQAPWRESENVEDRRNPSWGEWSSARGVQMAWLPRNILKTVLGLGMQPASPELMQRYMEDISALLPRSDVQLEASRELPRYSAPAKNNDDILRFDRPMALPSGVADGVGSGWQRNADKGRAEGGAVESDAPERSLVDRAWDARPWKNYATNPPSMLPQLGTALGLLHPRLGGAVRDMGMARELAKQGSTPAVMQGMPAGMHARAPEASHLSRPPAPMGMRQGVANSNRPMSRVDQYEAHLTSLERAGVPYEQWPSWQAFFRGLNGKADGGPVDDYVGPAPWAPR